MITIVTIAGPLQLQFLLGTLKRPIYPHYELYQDVSEYPFYPCSCIDIEDSRDEIHVMWVAMEEGRNLNHIIPLLPRRENRGTNWLINYGGSISPWLYIRYLQLLHDFFSDFERPEKREIKVHFNRLWAGLYGSIEL